MQLKSILKTIVPSSLQTFYREIRYVIRYNCRMTKLGVKKRKDKIVILFLVQRTEVWSSMSSVYQAACKEPNVRTCLIALPPFRNNQLDFETNDVYEFCQSVSESESLKAYGFDGKPNFNIAELNPDYIFFSVPYTRQTPSMYTMKELSKIGKLCFVPYSFSLLDSDILHISFNSELSEYAYFIFADSNITYNFCKRKMKYLGGFLRQTIFNVGYPRFDLFIEKKKSDFSNQLNILWIPRWTTIQETTIDGNEPSSFFLFKDNIIEYAKENNDIDVIIRPHPLAFSNYVKHGLMTEEDAIMYKKNIDETPNAFLDQNPTYMDSLLQADVLIADFSSLVIEFFLTGRPIIYFGIGSNFSKEFTEIYDTFYKVNNWVEVEKVLSDLRLGRDEKKEQRDVAIRNFQQHQSKKIGEAILDKVLEDCSKI